MASSSSTTTTINTTTVTFRRLQHTHQSFSGTTLCKYPLTLNAFKFQYSLSLCFSRVEHGFYPTKISPPLDVRAAHFTNLETLKHIKDQAFSKSNANSRTRDEVGYGFSSLRIRDKRIDKISARNNVGSLGKKLLENKDMRVENSRINLGRKWSREINSNSKDGKLVKSDSKPKRIMVTGGKTAENSEKRVRDQLREEKREKRSKESKIDSTEAMFRVGLDLCSKRGDVLGAIKLYDLARREGIKMGLYHYGVLLYLCSSAATGIVQPAKSGRGNRSLSTGESNRVLDVDSESVDDCGNFIKISYGTNDNVILVKSSEVYERSDEQRMNIKSVGMEVERHDFLSHINGKENLIQFPDEAHPQHLGELIQLMKGGNDSLYVRDVSSSLSNDGIQVSEDVKKYALDRGFEIYEKMCLEQVPVNEATLTSVARMAMSMGNGDMAFDMVKQMKAFGINPRLRSYSPAVSIFCSNGDIEKAFMIEKHMLENGVVPEEPELMALLKVSIEAGRSDKVYYLLHKLRESVRQISPSTADLIEDWFNSRVAQRVGKRKYDLRLIMKAIENGGGGWHGQGWLGKGKWTVSRTSLAADGFCNCCGEELAKIDLDPIETENFAESVASMAIKREKNSNFQKFQKWLDYYGPFEAVIDGANVGLFSQRRLKLSKINAVVNGIRQMIPSKKWPLIILHNRHITGDKIDDPVNKMLIEKWKNADALYATPTGSNDDWYWLYAAIKFRCLIVTNDEMRDHLFQLLGNDFFPIWKERHQVRFRFSDVGPVFHLPPPCSVAIQESMKGHWHIPVASEQAPEEGGMWLCITRANSHIIKEEFATSSGVEGVEQNYWQVNFFLTEQHKCI